MRLRAGISRLKEMGARFVLTPASARPLAALRVGVAGTLLLQVSFLNDQLFELFASTGILQGSISRVLAGPGTIAARDLMFLGLDERTLLIVIGVSYVVALGALVLGAITRVVAPVAWFTHWVLMNTGYSTNYGVDIFAHIFLFYFMFMPVSRVWSVDAWRKPLSEASAGARLSLRLVQLHLCIAYFASAAEKAVGPQWWDGEVIWRALTLPIYVQYDMTWLANHTWICKLAAWGTLVVEGLYCVFVWPRATRRPWVVATGAMHVGIAIFLGLEIFGIFMLVLTVAAFGVRSEPAGARAALSTSAERSAIRAALGA